MVSHAKGRDEDQGRTHLQDLMVAFAGLMIRGKVGAGDNLIGARVINAWGWKRQKREPP